MTLVPAAVSFASLQLLKDKLFTTVRGERQISSTALNTDCGKRFRCAPAPEIACIKSLIRGTRGVALTVPRVPTIIVCTSLLWRANRPGKLNRPASQWLLRMAPKYIFVTGGVVSSLGKGVAASSIGCLLESRGFK